MPRPARRVAAPTVDTAGVTTTTPSRGNPAIAIPPFMLDTPPHAPFMTTPPAVTNPPTQSIVPERNQNRRHARHQQQTPTANGVQEADPAQATGIPMSESVQQEEVSMLEALQQEAEEAKALLGLRDISSLSTWTLSSAKPGSALPQLRHPNTNLFWQSDGPQPHTLTLHFFKVVAIIKMRVYLDFELDESYTPTKMKFFAGMSEGALVEFGEWAVQEVQDPETGEMKSTVENVKGWIDVPLEGVGGREKRYFEAAEEAERWRIDGGARPRDPTAGNVLKAMVVQVRVCENHQNGKDTHVRGFQVFARDEAATKEPLQTVQEKNGDRMKTTRKNLDRALALEPAQWMGEPVIR